MVNKFLVVCVTILFFTNCNQNEKKSKESFDNEIKDTLAHIIEKNIAVFDKRLDIKMKRKYEYLSNETVITLQKYFDNGDTTKLLKIRAEKVNTDTLDVIQYHFLHDTLILIHDYFYNKKCGNGKECMTEKKYYFDKGKFVSSVEREEQGTTQSPPDIGKSEFKVFAPADSVIKNKMIRLELINKKYYSLPYPKQKK